MITIIIHSCLLLTLCSCEVIISRMTQMADLHDLRPAVNASVVLTTTSLLQCVMECSNSISCESLSHHSDKGTCLLHPFHFNGTIDAISEDGWESYGGSCAVKRDYIFNQTLDWCYRLVEKKKIRTRAEQFCLSNGARMSRITSLERHVHVSDLLYSRGITSAWIGGYSPDSDNKFVYEDGTPLSYCNWGIDEPMGEKYIRLKTNANDIFVWKSGSGFAARKFMCEIKW